MKEQFNKNLNDFCQQLFKHYKNKRFNKHTHHYFEHEIISWFNNQRYNRIIYDYDLIDKQLNDQMVFVLDVKFTRYNSNEIYRIKIY